MMREVRASVAAAGRPVQRLPALGQDMLHLIFTSLGDGDRQWALAVCRAWHAAFGAEPRLWPTMVLESPKLWCRDPVLQQTGTEDAVLFMDSKKEARLLSTAARLNRRATAVRLVGFRDQPGLVLGVLSVLPAGLTRLELHARCTGPLPAVTERFTRLQSVSLTGNGAEVDWDVAGTAALIPRLSALRLNYSLPEYEDHWDDYMQPPERRLHSGCLPGRTATALRGASQLHHLSLQAEWSEDVAALCTALPSLRRLDLSLVGLVSPYEEGAGTAAAAAAVAMLAEADHLTEVHLTADTGPGLDETALNRQLYFWEVDALQEEEEPVQLPALAAAVPRLASLAVRRGVHLPPDWRQLAGLTRLEIATSLWPQAGAGAAADEAAAGALQIDWSLPVTALTSLRVLYLEHALPGGSFDSALCALPALEDLSIIWPGDYRNGRQQLHLPPAFDRLSRLQSLHIKGYSVASVPPPVRHLTTLRHLSITSSHLKALPRGPYLAGLTTLDIPFYAGKRVPPALAAAVRLQVLSILLPRTLPAAEGLRLAALPALTNLRFTYFHDAEEAEGERMEWERAFRGHCRARFTNDWV